MAKCEVCGTELGLPFICSYCKGAFCSYHRLPEAHNCKMLHLARAQKPVYEEIPILRVEEKPWSRRITSKTEIIHLLAAWIVLSICFSTKYFFRFYSMFPLILTVYLCVVGTGFVFHELAHKFTAQKYGYWSEFRLWSWGLAMALFSSLLTLGSFIFAAPGATYILPRYNTYEWSEKFERKKIGIISLSGPLSNIFWASIFFFLSRFNGLLAIAGNVGFQVNLWLAAFNMIPLGGLDGGKILTWNTTVWAIVTIPLWAIEVINIFLV